MLSYFCCSVIAFHLNFIIFTSTRCDESLDSCLIFDQNVPVLLESKVCPSFIRDLQLSLAGRMQDSLLITASAVDSYISSCEQKCAKMMTILKPMYAMVGLSFPTVPGPRILSNYPMDDLVYTDKLREVNMEDVRLSVFRARRKLQIESKKAKESVRDINRDKGPDQASCSIKIELSHGQEVLQLIDVILLQIAERYNDEVSKRMKRKMACSVDRVSDIEEYRLRLVKNLHVRGILSREDKTSMRYYKDQFRFPNDTEPIILQVDAVYLERKGLLIITASHICFYRYDDKQIIMKT